jgi:PleD family two-component response regulator
MEDHEQKAKILIVEDHPATRKLLESILQEDYETLSAENGLQALEILKETGEVDLILLDIIMPELNGYEVCKKLKEGRTTENIPIIFLTILDGEDSESKGFALGVNEYIIKPVNRIRLKTRIKNQLDLRRKTDLLTQKNHELAAALKHIQTLHGILPICSFCKEIRSEDGKWSHIEEYVKNHMGAQFSHSVCPQCMRKNYPDIT